MIPWLNFISRGNYKCFLLLFLPLSLRLLLLIIDFCDPVRSIPVHNRDLAVAIENGSVFGPHKLHPKLPIAVESVPAHLLEKKASVDCSRIPECSQGAWSDFGLGLAGLVPTTNLCLKYTPAKSCVSKALSACISFLDDTEKKTLLSFARIMVSWCSDKAKAKKPVLESTECDSLALYDSISAHGCLSDVVHPHTLQGVSAQVPDSNIDLPKLVNSFLKNYYDTSTISCLHSAIEDACGKRAADLSLGPALEQSNNSSEEQESPDLSPNHSIRLSFSQSFLIFPLVSLLVALCSFGDF